MNHPTAKSNSFCSLPPAAIPVPHCTIFWSLTPKVFLELEVGLSGDTMNLFNSNIAGKIWATGQDTRKHRRHFLGGDIVFDTHS